MASPLSGHRVAFCQICLWSLLIFIPLVQANEVTVYGIAPAAEGEFLTAAFQNPSFAVGTDGVVTIAATSATDEFTAHGVFGVTMLEGPDGLVFDAQGTAYSESMSCAIDQRSGRAACDAVIAVGSSTTLVTFTPTQLPVVTVLEAPVISNPVLPSTSQPLSNTKPVSSPSRSTFPKSGLSNAAIIGIAVAIVVVNLIGLTFLLCHIRRRRLRQEASFSEPKEEIWVNPNPNPNFAPDYAIRVPFPSALPRPDAAYTHSAGYYSNPFAQSQSSTFSQDPDIHRNPQNFASSSDDDTMTDLRRNTVSTQRTGMTGLSYYDPHTSYDISYHSPIYDTATTSLRSGRTIASSDVKTTRDFLNSPVSPSEDETRSYRSGTDASQASRLTRSEARQMLEEMRIMREQVATFRAGAGVPVDVDAGVGSEVPPPEYTR